ncbi:putative vacuolar amino acid transporter YPQ3 [Exophiala dermatitidis]
MADLISLALTTFSSSSSKVHLTTREALSGIFGSISLACWIFLLVPQLIENYRNGSAEAISLAFIFVWFIGDICNLAGALWAGLVPVVIAIGVYFCIADGVLISQCLYYGIVNKRREGKALLDGEASSPSSSSAAAQHRQQDDGPDEEEPLLKRNRTNSITIPGSAERRHSSHSTRRRRSSAAVQNDQLAKILEESDESGTRLWFKNAMSVLAIIIVGAAGWALAYESGAWKPSSTSEDTSQENMAPGAQILGYLSAVAYLGARIPQIIKNAREKSCEGLSLLFFILSLLGNVTYGAGILFHSTDAAYIRKNLPWLIGSLGTMVEDVMIFAQFHMYRDREAEESRRGEAVF